MLLWGVRTSPGETENHPQLGGRVVCNLEARCGYGVGGKLMG